MGRHSLITDEDAPTVSPLPTTALTAALLAATTASVPTLPSSDPPVGPAALRPHGAHAGRTAGRRRAASRHRSGDDAATLVAALRAPVAAGAPTASRRHGTGTAPRTIPRHRPTRTPQIPARTPLYLAGAVALAVVITDQTGVFASTNAAAREVSQATPIAVPTAAKPSPAANDPTVANYLSGSRVSRFERRSGAPVPAGGAVSQVVGPAAAPSPVSTMKPGQTVPGNWALPNTGPMTSCFCARWGSFHEGIDLGGALGSPILAVGDGTVIAAGPAEGYGNWVVIRHQNGDVSIYGHMRYYYVKVGQTVTAGQEIALVGAEGQATGPHLHLSIRVGGLSGPYVDPVPWLAARGVHINQ